MTLLLKQIFGLFKLLNSDKGTSQIAAGVACGLVLGFTPAFSLQTLLVVAVILLFRVQAGAAFLTAAFFKVPAVFLDPAFDLVGGWALELEALTPIYTTLFHMPLVPFTRFNHSVVMGSGIVALALVVPTYFLSQKLIEKYRDTVVARWKTTKLWKAWTGTTFYKWYCTYEDLHG
ncbi:MAG: TIGR03546 family protein [Bdellovibrionales bacterium]|nr:TIGR03546 family protein [Bdellovibrionales bacterium]